MYDPGGEEQEPIIGDWMFEGEDGENCERMKEQKPGEVTLVEKRVSGVAKASVNVKEEGNEENKAEESSKSKKEKQGKRREERRRMEQVEKCELGSRNWKVLGTMALTRNKAQLFPTTRRPALREIVAEAEVHITEIDRWFSSTALQLGDCLTPDQRSRAMRMLYTWRDIFETDLLRIRRTDLIEHAIILEPGAKPHRARIPLYTEEEITFCKRLIPKMEQAGLIYRCDSEWGARTKFPLKPRAETLPKDNRLRMVHNFIPLNRVTEKSQYPCPRIEQIVYTVLKKGKSFFFTTDAANSYWAIPVRSGDETKLGFVTPYGMYCYKVIGQGLTGGTHTYSRFRDLVFGAIPEGFTEEKEGNRRFLQGYESLIGDTGEVAFDGMIDDSYGSATTFDAMYRFLHEQFFSRCCWGPMYLKDSKSCFFTNTLSFVGLEAGPNGLRPSLRKRQSILEWPVPTSQAEVEAFCYLTPFLWRFIPGRAELVRIMKYGKKEVEVKGKEDKGCRRKTFKEDFRWSDKRNVAFEAIKQAIINNAMASPDPDVQYHLAVDASKSGLGGVLFQLVGVCAGTEASSTENHRLAQRIILFISFRLSDVESRYSNSEREALAVIRCLAEVKWMIVASKYPVIVYTDHSALRTLLTGQDNDAHGRIAKWQERLGEYHIRLLHRSAKVHFMGIADGLSRLPTRLLSLHVAEDTEGPRPIMGLVIPVIRLATDVVVNGSLAVTLRMDHGFWIRDKGGILGGRLEDVQAARQIDERYFIGTVTGEEEEDLSGGCGKSWSQEGGSDMRWRRWKIWLESEWYGIIVQARLNEIDGGVFGAKDLELGRSTQRALERSMRKYVLVDAERPRLFYRERNGELSTCIRENEVEGVLRSLHEGHGHFAVGLTLGRAHGRVYWPTRAKDIGEWVSSCDACQRVTRIQKAGELRSVIQFKPMDMIGMDFVGPINPPCAATGYAYVLIVVDYYSRFLWAVGTKKADQASTMRALLEHVFPVVGWPLAVYTDNGSHFTGSTITKMWADHGVLHFPSAISHPQSVGLSERYVQLLIGRIRLSCITLGSSRYWGREIRDAVLSINTRCIRVHGYSPAEILLGFNPSTTPTDKAGLDDWLKQTIADERGGISAFEKDIHSFVDLQSERGLIAGNRLAQQQDKLVPRQTVGYRKPKPGDLVLVRDFQHAKDKGNKLAPRWMSPQIVQRLSKAGVSAHIRQLHDPPNITKRYHIDDLVVYIPRSASYPTVESDPVDKGSGGVEWLRGAVGEVGEVLRNGQRAYDLSGLNTGGDMG